MKIALISCSATKKSYTCPARELYSPSELFSLSYEYAKMVTDRVYILSALHGLVREEQVLAPYNKNLNDMAPGEQRQWAEKVLAELRNECDLQQDEFIFLAGKTYGQNILPKLKHVSDPLKGLQIEERMKRLRQLITEQKNRPVNMCEQLHRLFNELPRYDWEHISDIPFENGIYIVFEKGETYCGMDRIVRVGTHNSDGRLKNRLRDHFVRENHDGSIFRKNIGKAILNAYHDPYLKNWTINTSIPENAHYIDAEKNADTEKRVSDFLRKSFTFMVIPVEGENRRLRLEEGIIAALNIAADFGPGKTWSGRFSPEEEIRNSGLWLKQGLDAEPLTEDEYREIVACCRGERATKTVVYNKLIRDRIPEIIEAAGKSCVVETLNEADYLRMLDIKLGEELEEYRKNPSLEELADILEVLRACAVARGYSIEELEQARAAKAETNGGFERRLCLKKVEENRA